MFSPTAWLSRSRFQSNSSADFSKDGSLEGLNYLSQLPQGQGSASDGGSARCDNTQPCSDIFHDEDEEDDDNEEDMDDFKYDGLDYEIDLKTAKDMRSKQKGHSRHRSMPATTSSLHHDSVESLLAHAQNHYDIFKADVSLDSFSQPSQQCAHTHEDVNAQTGLAGNYNRPVPPQQQQGPTQHPISRLPTLQVNASLQKTPSFGNGSCISGLSADDTNYEYDDKTIKSYDVSVGNRSRGERYAGNGNRRNHRRSFSKASKGRDFCGAFDHLDHLINATDLMDDGPIPAPVTTGVSRPSEDDLHYTSQANHTHFRAASSSQPRLLSERPRLIHQRCQSDTHVLRGMSQRSPSSCSRISRSSSISYNKSTKPVAAHATLQECIIKSKASAMESNGSNHTRLLSLSSRPQILSSRSTSLTVQSSAATTLSASSGQYGAGVVWSGQPIDNFIGSSPSPPAMHRRCRTVGYVSEEHGYVPDIFQNSHSNHRSDISRTSAGYLSHSESLGQNPASGSVSTSNSASKTGTHMRNMSDAESSITQRTSSVTEDKTTVSIGMDSGTEKGSVSSSRRKKSAIKNEIKFLVKRMVPGPLKKITSSRNKVNLERSNGCLT